MGAGIPRDVLAFLHEHIVSVEQLEVLLLLRRTAPRPWSPEEVSDELRSSPISAGLRLKDLAGRRLIERDDGRFRYVAGTRERVIAELEAVYAERRFGVIDQIFARPVEPLRVFADAFRIKKEEDDG